jgi:hypothetical protein
LAAVIDRCAFSPATLEECLALFTDVASLPGFGRRWLQKLSRDGLTGELTVDVSNVLSLSLTNTNRAQPAPTEDELRPLQWWAALVRGSVLRSDDRAVLSIEAYPLSETPVAEGQGAGAFDALPELDRWGYRVPFAVAVALSAAVSACPERTLVRASRASGRGGVLDVVELHVPAAGEGVGESLANLARAAGGAVAFAVAYRDGDGWGYIEGFNDEFASENFAPVVVLPEPVADDD